MVCGDVPSYEGKYLPCPESAPTLETLSLDWPESKMLNLSKIGPSVLKYLFLADHFQMQILISIGLRTLNIFIYIIPVKGN